MLFQSHEFILLFLPVALTAYYLSAGSLVLRQWLLITASLVFYGWWDVRFVPLLVGQVGTTWFFAWLAQRLDRRWPLIAAVLLNLASLATFKYLDFLLAIVQAAVGLSLPPAHIVLPIGISFFSFQLISYSVDRYRGNAPMYPFRPFALFVLLFPHLIAGPIVRHNELIPQFADDPRRDGWARRFGTGTILFTVGFAKKVLLADNLALVVDPLFTDAARRTLDFGEAWTAALGFSFQLFLDFSAYTEMAIGIALMFGVLLPENFRRPYLATDLRDFWRRWHISLSTFVRDYLYIPLGGSRQSFPRYVAATLATMALCGLWHGAGWTYVAWGAWHGVGLVACHGWQRIGRPLPALAGWALTMVFVLAGWVLFRAGDFSAAVALLASMSGAHGFGGRLQAAGALLAAAAVSALVPSAHEIKDQVLRPIPAVAVGAAILAIVCVLAVGKGAPVQFIYFQF